MCLRGTRGLGGGRGGGGTRGARAVEAEREGVLDGVLDGPIFLLQLVFALRAYLVVEAPLQVLEPHGGREDVGPAPSSRVGDDDRQISRQLFYFPSKVSLAKVALLKIRTPRARSEGRCAHGPLSWRSMCFPKFNVKVNIELKVHQICGLGDANCGAPPQGLPCSPQRWPSLRRSSSTSATRAATMQT